MHFGDFWGNETKFQDFYKKSVKIVKNHKNIQIHEFQVPRVLVLRDSEKMLKKEAV